MHQYRIVKGVVKLSRKRFETEGVISKPKKKRENLRWEERR